MNTADLLLDTTLSDRAARLAECLNRKVRRCYSDCLYATSTIARWLGWSPRKVQMAIRELAGRGLVEVVRDYGLKTRRRIRLVWRVFLAAMPEPTAQPQPAPDASVGANAFGQARGECQLEFALTDPSPPDPLYSVSEDAPTGGGVDDPGDGDPAYGHPSPEGPGSSSSPPPIEAPTGEPEGRDEPTGAEVAELVDQAAAVFGAGPATAGRISTLLREFTPGWIRAALGIAAKKARREPVGFGYLFRTLDGFQVEGGPPAEPAAAIPTPTPPPSQEQTALALARIFGPRPQPGGGS